MEINILIDEEFEGKIDPERLRILTERILLAEGVPLNTELGLVITGQERIRELNRAHRGLARPTDVLAFAMSEGKDETPFISPPDGTRHLGEVIISYPQAVIQAAERRHPVEKELAILMIHGILHLLGYDHEQPGQAPKMEARETAILDQIERGPA